MAASCCPDLSSNVVLQYLEFQVATHENSNSWKLCAKEGGEGSEGALELGSGGCGGCRGTWSEPFSILLQIEERTMEELARTMEHPNPRCSTCGTRSKQIFHVKSFQNPNSREELIKDASDFALQSPSMEEDATLSRVETHLSGNTWEPACRDASIDFICCNATAWTVRGLHVLGCIETRKGVKSVISCTAVNESICEDT